MHAANATRNVCPVCGAVLPPGAETGQCTPCLLRLALDPDVENALDAPADLDDAGDGDVPDRDADGMPAVPGRFADYELLERIGRGAMGVVFKARQTSLDRLVALKVLDFAGRLPADAARRFRAEASAAAALRHRGIVTIHDVGVYRSHHYLAMDLVDGPTLAELVAHQPLPPNRAARILAAVAEAVQCAHERGILHRDLKPSNILLDAADQPHVADFGLAKRMGADADMTIPGQIMGSPNYMSPEQARGAPLGSSSDVHALGAVLYHCLAGRPPFFGQTIPDTLHHVVHGEPVALRLLVAGVSRDLETIVSKCLEKDPAKRYPDARSLAEDLQRFLRREPIHARAVGRSERLWRWCLRHPAIAALSAATTFLVLAVAIGSPVAALRIRAERERAEDNLYAADMNLVQQALAQSSRGQARALLERHRPARGQVDRRGFEWRYLWSLSEADERTVWQAPSGGRHLVALGNTALIAAGDTVWNMEQPARPVFTLPSGSVALAYDAVNNLLLARGPDGFVAWSATTWEPHTLHAGDSVHAVALSMDGRWMATGGNRLRLWAREGQSWREVASQPRAFMIWHNAHTLAFSPDGRSLVSGTGESWANRCSLEFWSVPELEQQPRLPDTPGHVLSLAYSPDGHHLVTGCWNGQIRIWNMVTRTEVQTTMRHHGFVIGLAFSPEDPDVFATAASDRTVRLWSLRTGTELVSLQGPLDHLFAMTFAGGGRRLLTLEMRGRVAEWDTAQRDHESALIVRGPSTIPLGFSADSKMLATFSETGALRFWDVAQRREIGTMVQTLDLTGVLTRDFEIIAPAITRDLETLAIGMLDGRVQLWHLPTRTMHIWKAHAQQMRNVAFSPNGRTLATVADDGILKFWDVTSRSLLSEHGIPGSLAAEDFNVPLVWSADGRILALASATDITLHDGVSGRLLHTLVSRSLIYSVRFSPDSRLLVSAHEDFHLAFWDPRNGVLLDRLPASHQESVYDLCFSPDGRTLATVVDNVKLWSVATRQEVSTLRGHERNIFAALFSPDGNVLVTADYEGAVRLWTALSFETIDGRGRSGAATEP